MTKEAFELEILKNLREHLRRYPAMRQEDIVKFVFQAMLGVGHLLSSRGAAEDYDELTLLSAVVKEIAAYTALHEHELPVIVAIKHAYNVTRSYKHGGKVI